MANVRSSLPANLIKRIGWAFLPGDGDTSLHPGERGRERLCSHFGSSRPAALSCGGALEDGPPRLLAVPSNLGVWTFLQAGEGLSLVPAATLLQRPCWGEGPRAITVKVTIEHYDLGGDFRDCKTFNLNTFAGEDTIHCPHNFLTFAAPLITRYFNAGRGTPSSTSPWLWQEGQDSE